MIRTGIIIAGLILNMTFNMNCSLSGNDSEKEFWKRPELILNNETGRLTIIYRNKGETPIKLSRTGKYYQLENSISAGITEIDSEFNEKNRENPQKYYDEGLLIGPKHIGGLKVRRKGIAGHEPNWPHVDREYYLKKGEIVGSSCFIWEIDIWEDLGKALKKYRKPYKIKTFHSRIPLSQSNIEIDQKLYLKMKFMKRKHEIRNQEREFTKTPTSKVAGKKEFPLFKLEMRNGKNYTPKRDEDICLYMDESTGRLFSYLSFDGTIYRKKFEDGYISFSKADYKTIDLDKIVSVMNIRSDILGLANDYFLTDKETDDYEKMWSIKSLNWDDDTNNKHNDSKSLDRKLTLENFSYIFGSSCYIWELALWEDLGKRLKQYRTPFYLFPSDSSLCIIGKSKYIPGICIKVDAKLYNQMEKLRKKLETEKTEK